jgi:UDP-N-acetylglucosamine transferase subunit ALG13
MLFSRAHRFAEAGDDHQSQLAAELAGRGLAFECEPETVGVDDLLSSLKVEIVRMQWMPNFEVGR